MKAGAGTPPVADRGERVALFGLIAFTAAAVTGYGVFALHPEMLPADGLATAIYNRAFPLFARAHIGLAALVLGWVLVRRAGGRWLPAAALVCAAAFAAEYAGTRWGVPFGGYEYTGLLGPKIAGRVPWVIPMSWFLMALPAYAMARAVAPGDDARGRILRVVLAAATLTAWDLALDPAMSHLTPYWYWEVDGPYYGMPLVNLAGWMGTGLVMMVGMDLLNAGRWVPELPLGWLAGYYAVLLAMPMGMVVAAAEWGAAATTVVALLLLAAGHAAVRGGAPSPRAEGHDGRARVPRRAGVGG